MLINGLDKTADMQIRKSLVKNCIDLLMKYRSADVMIINAQQARELATELNKLADGMEEKFYIKVLKDNDYSYINVCEDGSILISSNSQGGSWKTQFTQIEIDSNPDLKKFDSDDFKVRVEDDK